MTRKCKCGCGASLDGMRRDAKWASESCRQNFLRGLSPFKACSRRPSRDGNGVRIYVAPSDTTDRIMEKIAAARERVAA